MSTLARATVWLHNTAHLGRMWLYSRRPHIEEHLPADLDGAWIAIATAKPIQHGAPVYGTPAHRAARGGERFWIFCEPGEYFVYAVRADAPQAALSAFYREPDAARLIAGGVVSAPGFRAALSH